MRGFTIHEIGEQLNALQDAVASGEFTEEQLADTLEGLEGEAEDKLEGMGVIYKNYESMIAAYKREGEIIDKRIESLKKSQVWIESNINTFMRLINKEKLETSKMRIAYRISEGVVIFNEGIVPEDYKKQIITVSVCKADIKNAIKSGAEVPGAALEVRRNLQVK